MRRLILAVLAAGLIAVAAPAVMAGAGPRLHGSFNTVGTIKGNDLGVPAGTKTDDVFKFTSRCKAGACAKIKLDRDGGDNSHYKSTLRKTRPGVYKGTEGPEPYTCLDNDEATFTAKHTIKVTRARNGKATAIGGTTNIKIAGCSAGTFVNYTLKGKLDN